MTPTAITAITAITHLAVPARQPPPPLRGGGGGNSWNLPPQPPQPEDEFFPPHPSGDASPKNTPTPDLVVTLTRDHVLACRCGDRSWTNRAVALLAGHQWIGSNGMLIRGWLSACIGRSIPVAQYERALSAKSRAWHRQQCQQRQATLDLDVTSGAQVADPGAVMKAGWRRVGAE
jgi:hypothetical protein